MVLQFVSQVRAAVGIEKGKEREERPAWTAYNGQLVVETNNQSVSLSACVLQSLRNHSSIIHQSFTTRCRYVASRVFDAVFDSIGAIKSLINEY